MQALFRDYWLIWHHTTGAIPRGRILFSILLLVMLGTFLAGQLSSFMPNRSA